MAPVAIPETIPRHISAPDLLPFQKWRMYSPHLALTIGFFSTRPGREPWERGWSYRLLWLAFTKAPCKRTQQCWISHVESVCIPTRTHVVGSCCTKFETGQTFIDVQTDATTPNMLGQQCWECVRPFARSLTWTSTVEREQNVGGIWQYLSFRFFFFSSLLSQSIGWWSCAHFGTQNNLLSRFFGLFAQASEARKDSGKVGFVITRKRGRRSADQKARRRWVRGT